MIWAANWKMNLAPKDALNFVQNLSERVEENLHSQIWIFPQNFSLGLLENVLSRTPMQWGAQNIVAKEKGAYTGENSAELLKEMGANLSLVGHSERRKYFNENDEMVSEKVGFLQKQDLCPLICVGESIEQREKGITNEVLEQQLEVGLKGLDPKKEFAIAYEPVWAIGTGQVASPEQAEEAHQFIRKYLLGKFSADLAAQTPILYGGSVKAENAPSLAQKQNINGFLIGGASLEIDSFCQIIEHTK